MEFNNTVIVKDIVEATDITKHGFKIKLNKLQDLALYKNIYSDTYIKKTTSLAYVKIYVSYDKENFKIETAMKLYDSKCRKCESKNQKQINVRKNILRTILKEVNKIIYKIKTRLLYEIF